LESFLVSPYATILNDEKLLVKLTEILNEFEPVYVVVGNPMHLSGLNSVKSKQANEFANLIRSIFSGPIYLVDERLSTSNAYSQMRDSGKSERESKSVIDQIAAVNILESALLSEKAGNSIGESI
jgi:putative Holliday junction resolvase